MRLLHIEETNKFLSIYQGLNYCYAYEVRIYYLQCYDVQKFRDEIEHIDNLPPL